MGIVWVPLTIRGSHYWGKHKPPNHDELLVTGVLFFLPPLKSEKTCNVYMSTSQNENTFYFPISCFFFKQNQPIQKPWQFFCDGFIRSSLGR